SIPWESSVETGRFTYMDDSWGISKMTDVETLRYMRHLQRERAILDARMARAMAHFHGLRQDFEDGKYAGDEIAAALSWSPLTAGNQLADARGLVERLPDTLVAMESGQLDMVKARAILDWTEPLPIDQAREVAATVQEWSVGRTAAAVRQKLSREVHKVDPAVADAVRRER